MNGDITRDTLDARKHFARVLWQQGRVALDADSNEQTAILLHYIRTMAMDLMGRHGGPRGENEGFLISDAPHGDFLISAGHYYVDGILCENEMLVEGTGLATEPETATYLKQPNYPQPPPTPPSGTSLFYLDVWERPISYFCDASIREVALGGPDTATRTKVVWQVKFVEGVSTCEQPPFLEPRFQPPWRGLLRARVTDRVLTTDPCVTSPESRYRGAENQLYRVEIHQGVRDLAKPTLDGVTFKWSRDNGSVCFAIRSLDGSLAELQSLGRDDPHTLNVGDVVEVLDDDSVLHGEPGLLAQVDQVMTETMTVKLTPKDASKTLPSYGPSSTNHPFLRRWDYRATDPKLLGKDGALQLTEGQWLSIEDGIEIQFAQLKVLQPEAHTENAYRGGDFWLIPARVAIGDVEWPPETDGTGKVVLVDSSDKVVPSGGRPWPQARPPHGVEHHYAPLALVSGGKVTKVCRYGFDSLSVEEKTP